MDRPGRASLVHAPRRARWASCALALAALLSSCQPRIAVELVEVEEVEDERVEAGHHLAVTGQRFLLGHPCTFVLRGLWHHPGRAVERAERTIVGEARTAERAEALVTDDVVRALGGRATFEGDLEVRFEAASIPSGSVHGILRGVTLDFLPAGRMAHGRIEDVERSLGARFADHDVETAGVELAEVSPHGLLGSLGLLAGDHVLARGGLRVLEPLDLALDSVPDRERTFRATRGTSDPFVVRVRAPADAGLVPARAFEIAALLVLVALVLFAASRPRSARGPERLAGVAHLVIGAVLGAAVFRAITSGLAGDATVLTLAAAIAIGAAGLSDQRDGALNVILRVVAFVAFALGAAASAGTLEVAMLGTLVPGEGVGDPRHYLGFGSALAPAAALALLAACPAPRSSAPLSRVLDAVALGLAGSVATAFAFGGVGGSAPHDAASFVVRSVLVVLAAAMARTSFAPSTRLGQGALAALTVLLSAGGATLSLLEPLAHDAADVVAETAIVFAVSVSAASAALRMRRPERALDALEL